jgi:hypothetical protein
MSFMGHRNKNAGALSWTPSDVVDFLIASDVSGKTVVHTAGCTARGVFGLSSRGPPLPACACPPRLAWGTVDSMIGRLRTSFFEVGCIKEDNPAASRMVKHYLSDIRGEQLRQGIVPKQAKPIFSAKIRQISEAVRDALAADIAPSSASTFVMLRFRAMLVLDAHSLKRGAELGTTLTNGIVRFPDDSGLLFNYTWGKTLRSGSSHIFGVARKPNDPDMCPVACIDAYVAGAAALGFLLAGPGSFLFRPWRHGAAPDVPLAPEQLASDLRLWMVRCGIFEGETFHGLRTGGAIELALTGESLRSVMDSALWKRPSTALRYMKIWEVMCASVTGSVPPPLRQGELATDRYSDMNNMIGFFSAYAPHV